MERSVGWSGVYGGDMGKAGCGYGWSGAWPHGGDVGKALSWKSQSGGPARRR
ncbi:MAG: hypothetical protein LBV00_01355 [Propionibacteriaceae bacterium]|nr:hypothetical protein [Propionibacteriaceae bacterium]